MNRSCKTKMSETRPVRRNTAKNQPPISILLKTPETRVRHPGRLPTLGSGFFVAGDRRSGVRACQPFVPRPVFEASVHPSCREFVCLVRQKNKVQNLFNVPG